MSVLSLGTVGCDQLSGPGNAHGSGVVESESARIGGRDERDGSNGKDGAHGKDGEDGADGTDGFSSLMATTELPVGDADCSNGGLRFGWGLDNGDGGEVPRDGVLGPGEVDGENVICNGESGSPVASMEPPPGPPGQFTLNATGGTGAEGSGGNGGHVMFDMHNTEGGHIKIFETGMADASFVFPETHVHFGDSPLVVEDDVTISVVSDNTGLQPGDLYIQNELLLLFDGIEGITITGIHVLPTATVTFTNELSDINPVVVEFADDVFVEGTLTTEFLVDGVSRRDLSLRCGAFHSAETGLVDLSGASVVDGPGGNGGELIIQAYVDDVAIAFNDSFGGFFNRGVIDVSGGDGTVGGSVLQFHVRARAGFFNSGLLDASGGNGSEGRGGNGAYSLFRCRSCVIHNSGTIDYRGGDGHTEGGQGGQLDMGLSGVGTVNSGTVLMSGGSVDEACTDTCLGGPGGYFGMIGARAINSGDIDVSGGDAPSGTGRAAGNINITNWGLVTDAFFLWTYAEGVTFSGNLDLSGGTGLVGGNAGRVNITVHTGSHEQHIRQQEIRFLGYTDLRLNGGNGETDGGRAGLLSLNQRDEHSGFGSGSILVTSDISARGGDGRTGAGGNGASMSMFSYAVGGIGGGYQWVRVAGDLNASGGNGPLSGGDAGTIWLDCLSGVEILGDLTADGGTGAEGGNAGWVRLTARDGNTLAGEVTISAQGGAATGDGLSGGNGGRVSMEGYAADNLADVLMGGGDADITTGTGGNGGSLLMLGPLEGATNGASVVEIAGGAAATPGFAGEVYVGGTNQTSLWLP